MQFVDCYSDHIDRPINIRHVLDMCNKARTRDDGTRVFNPTFTHVLTFYNLYDNCVCGHDIVYNCMATCLETGKSFIVGSDCINTVCNAEHWTLRKRCCHCNTIGCLKTKPYCSECSLIIKTVKKESKYELGFGQYKTETYLWTWVNHNGYCNWVKSLELESCNAKIQRFKLWIEKFEKYKPKIN